MKASARLDMVEARSFLADIAYERDTQEEFEDAVIYVAEFLENIRRKVKAGWSVRESVGKRGTAMREQSEEFKRGYHEGWNDARSQFLPRCFCDTCKAKRKEREKKVREAERRKA